MEEVKVPHGKPIRLLEWLVKVDDWVKYGKPIVAFRHIEDPSTGIKTKELQLKSKHVGRVKKLCLDIGQVATPGRALLVLESCQHPVVMKDMCAECGQDLRLLKKGQTENCARVAMVPNIPELKISDQQAEELGKQDQERLHKLKKLVLLVDLDQTLIHTTQVQAFAAMCKNDKNFYKYNLGKQDPTLYTKLRPHCREFLEAISEKFELQIVTFGSRQYAHKIAEFIDPGAKFFAHRILSRDECFNPMRKSGNLRHLFPCGDSMVCIIDDRDDVWNAAPNLVLVKKYSYFPGTGDINSPEKLEAKKAASGSNNNKVTPEQKQSPRKRKTNTEVSDEAHLCKIRKSDETPAGNPVKDSETSSTDLTPSSTTESENTSDDSNRVNSTTEASAAASAANNQQNSTSTSPVEPEISREKDISSPSDSSSDVRENTPSESSPVECQDKPANNDGGDRLSGDAKNAVESTNTENNTNARLLTKSSTNNCVGSKTPETHSTKDNSSESADNATCEPIPDNDDYLLYLQHVLTEVHRTYYEAYDKFLKGEFENSPDLRGVIPFIRSKVLFDCHIVFTGVVPSNYKPSPQQHKAYICATQLGAVVDQSVSKQTTHLIGGKKGTIKYQEAKKMGSVKLVSVEWLYACSERWERVSEQLFPITSTRSNNGCGSREGTPPVTKAVKWSANASAPTYNPVTGKLVKKSPSSRCEGEAMRQYERKQPPSLYSSLEDPEVVVPLSVEVSAEPSTSKPAAVRTRKPSMADMMGIEYSLSSNDISEMGKEVDDLLSSDEENNDSNLGTLIENVASSSSNESASQLLLNDQAKREENKSDAEDSSSSEEEFDHMAEMLDHEMHYDDSDDLETLD